jgi:hypothetical protein
MNKPTHGLAAIHPGEFLKETLDELELTQAWRMCANWPLNRGSC